MPGERAMAKICIVDDHWLPVKTVLEKPVKPDELLKAVEEALKK